MNHARIVLEIAVTIGEAYVASERRRLWQQVKQGDFDYTGYHEDDIILAQRYRFKHRKGL